ncbi:MAG: hypothetical protein AAFY82_09830 [Pseudomonadota bacterium]
MRTPTRAAPPNAFWLALALNFVWINISEVARYFGLVKPMLHDAFPGADHIGAVTPLLFASWMLWDTILILAATGFFWMFLTQFGATIGRVVIASLSFTVTVFGLLWLGVVNMGLAPSTFLWAALPLAWLEQVIAAAIVYWAMRRG